MKSSVTTALWGSVGVLLLVTILLPDLAMTDSHHREVRQVATTCSTTGKILSNTSCCGILSRPSLFLPYNYLMSANEISGHCCRDRFTYGSTANFTYTYTVTNYPNRCFCDSTLPACHAPAQDPCMAGSNMVRVDDSTGQCGKLTVSSSNVNYTSSPQEKSGVCCRLNAMANGQSVPNVINSVSKLPGSCYCGSDSTTPPANTSPPPTSPPDSSISPTTAPSSSLTAPPASLPPDSSTPQISTTPPSVSSTPPPTTLSVSTAPPPTTPPVSTTPPVTTAPPSTTDPVSTTPPGPTTLPPTTLPPTTPPVSTTPPPTTPPVSTTLPPTTPPVSTTPPPTTPPVSTTLPPTTPPVSTTPPPTTPLVSTTLPPTTPPVSTTPPPTTPPVSTTLLPTTPPVSTTFPPTTPTGSTTLPPTTPPVSTTFPPTTLPASTTFPPTTLPASTTLPPTTLPLSTTPDSTSLPPTTPPASTTLPPTTPLASTTLPPTTPLASTTLPPTTPPASTTLPPTTPAVSTTPPVSTSSPPTTTPPETTPSTTAPTITSTTASTTTTAPSCTVTKTPVAATRNNTCCGSLTVYNSFNLAFYTFSKQEKSGTCCRMNPVSSSQTALKSLATYPGDCYCDKVTAPECFDACPVPGFARMAGGTVLTDPCARSGIVTFSTADIEMVCHGVYIYDPAGPVAFLPVLYMPSTCADFFSQMEAYTLHGKSANATFNWTDQVIPLDPPVAGLSAFLPTPTVIDPLQAACAGPACAYNPVNMSSLIILSGCKLYSYGYTKDASGIPTYTGEFRSASVALENPATCQSTTAGAVYKCWKFTDASVSLCNGDTGAPIYCPLATGEWVLYGLLDLVATCGTSASFAVIPVSPAA